MSKVKRFAKKLEKPDAKAMSAAEMRAALKNRKARTIVRDFAPGLFFEVQRVEIGTYLAAGLLPQHFHTIMMEVLKERDDKVKAKERVQQCLDELQPEELTVLSTAKARFAIAACVSPKIVIGEPQNDKEISLLEVPEETQQEIFNWVMAGCPGLPIEVGGEEVDIEDLNLFRPKQTGGKPFTLEPDGEPLRDEAIAASGD